MFPARKCCSLQLLRQKRSFALRGESSDCHETLWNWRVKEFGPLIVSIDTEGRNMFEENKVIFNQRNVTAVEEICKHVNFIK